MNGHRFLSFRQLAAAIVGRAVAGGLP
ncbi:hypothetical protein FAIPA1_600019 [Frankia sp. AiPs1]